MIRCQACGFENDQTRVFCQNCGTRLQIAGQPVAAAAPERAVRKKMVQRREPSRLRLPVGFSVLAKEAIFIGLLGALMASFVQALRPPDALPAPVAPRPAAASLLAADIRAAMASDVPQTVEISPGEANNFLVSRVAGAEDVAFWQARLARAYVTFQEGKVNFGIEQRWAGHPVYLQLVARPVAAERGTSAVVEAGSIGRLPVPSFLLGAFQRSFQPVLDALDVPLSWMSRAQSVTLTPGAAVVSFPGRKR